MIKAVKFSLGFVLLIVALSLRAQPNASQFAEEEAVRRQEATITLHNKVVAAQEAQRKGYLVDAGKLYQEAVSLFPKVGPGVATVELEKKIAINGLVDVRLQLARDAQRRGNYAEANEQISSALKLDPKNDELRKFKTENDKLIFAQRGNVPSAETLAKIPDIQKQKIAAGTLVQDGKVLFEAGKLDEAEAKLKIALQQEPENVGANYYLNLIKEARFKLSSKKRDMQSKAALVEVQDAWSSSIKRESLQIPNPAARGDMIYTSKGRQSIKSKLDKIRLPEALFEGLPLGEVLKSLRDESKRRDPEQVGVNFMYNPNANAPAPFAAPNPADPTAAVFTPAPVAPVDQNNITVNISPALNDIRLADILDAIVQVSDQPIQYQIEDYAVIFSPKAPEGVSLYTRVFKVNPNTFQQGLESVSALSISIQTGSGGGGGGGGGGQDTGAFSIPRVSIATVVGGQGGGGAGQNGVGISSVTRTNLQSSVNQMVRDFFTAAGVDFGPPGTLNGKAVFFNDRAGTLMVRATLQDLEIISTAIETLNFAPPQVQIEAKFAEISQQDTKELGFDWFIGNTVLGGGRLGAQAGTAPSFQGNPSDANPSGFFPGPAIPTGDPFTPFIGGILPSSSDTFLTGGLRGSAPAVATLTGILTDPQFRIVIRALEQRAGSDILAAPKLTTLSGRQAQISVLDLITIVTDVEIEQSGSGGATGGGTGGNNNSTPGAIGSTIEYTTQTLPFGPVLDVLPSVSADGYSIQMTLIPTITEFVGYDDPGDFVPQAQSVGGDNLGIPLAAQLPLPRFRLRQVTTSCNVWDGQTVMLGGLITDAVTKFKDKVPLLGDLPFLGRLFRSEGSSSTKRNLMIFVTPTLIDPAGNRVHADEEMPFARVSVPVQPVPVANP